jgi:probable HAF family extracellular repeat protein
MKSIANKLLMTIIVCATMCTGCKDIYTEVRPPLWLWSYVSSINNNGDVAGYGKGMSGRWKGFVYSGRVYTELLPPGCTEAYASSINDNGDVAGYGNDEGTGIRMGFVYSGGVYTELLPPEWTWAYASSINNTGAVVGYGGTIYGTSTQKGFLYSEGVYTELLPPGWTEAYASSINDNGDVAGYILRCCRRGGWKHMHTASITAEQWLVRGMTEQAPKRGSSTAKEYTLSCFHRGVRKPMLPV